MWGSNVSCHHKIESSVGLALGAGSIVAGFKVWGGFLVWSSQEESVAVESYLRHIELRALRVK